MARGYPDFYRAIGKTIEGNFLPNTATPPSWIHDDFNVPVCKWHSPFGTVNVVTSFVVAGTTYYPYQGSSMMVQTSPAGGRAIARRYIGTPPQLTYLGFSVYFLFGEKGDFLDAADSLVLLFAEFRTGTLYKGSGISYNPRTYNWYYFDDAGAWVLIGNFRIAELAWHYAKLIIDPINDNYVMLQVDQQVFSLAGISYDVFGLVGPEYYNLYLQTRADVADIVYLLVDDYKVTYGET